MEKVALQRNKDGISPKNRLSGAYIYGSRGVSPRNVLTKAEFYNDEVISINLLSSLYKKARRLLEKG
ncbi:MAG: hypothetical protein FWG29_03710 [Treponema sp.]|nr:hypothetical protein [Treponema sp.]